MENREEIISRLKFISHIQKDEKIDVRHVSKQPNNFITKIYRTIIYPDNRTNTLKFIKEVIDRSFEILESYMSNENILAVKTMLLDLIKGNQGICNLKFTYSDDIKFCCDIEVIIQNMLARIISIRNRNESLFQDLPEIKF